MGELEDLVGDIGVKQWVKNRFISQLKEWSTQEKRDVDAFIAEFNIAILQDFKKVANEAVTETIEKASVLLAKPEGKPNE